MLARAMAYGVAIPAELEGESDPMEVLAWSAVSRDQHLISILDQTLTEAETEAVSSATLVSGAVGVIDRARALGIGVAIVSNNSAECIVKFLQIQGLSNSIAAIVARPPERPEKMKPDPYVVLRALEILEIKASNGLMVGDSLTDIQAAQAVGVPIIALANRPAKIEPFTALAPDAVILDMTTLADALER